MHIVPLLPSVPVVPLLQRPETPSPMFDMLHRYQWVLEPVLYADARDLLGAFDDAIIGRAETYLNQRKEKALKTVS